MTGSLMGTPLATWQQTASNSVTKADKLRRTSFLHDLKEAGAKSAYVVEPDTLTRYKQNHVEHLRSRVQIEAQQTCQGVLQCVVNSYLAANQPLPPTTAITPRPSGIGWKDKIRCWVVLCRICAMHECIMVKEQQILKLEEMLATAGMLLTINCLPNSFTPSENLGLTPERKCAHGLPSAFTLLKYRNIRENNTAVGLSELDSAELETVYLTVTMVLLKRQAWLAKLLGSLDSIGVLYLHRLAVAKITANAVPLPEPSEQAFCSAEPRSLAVFSQGSMPRAPFSPIQAFTSISRASLEVSTNRLRHHTAATINVSEAAHTYTPGILTDFAMGRVQQLLAESNRASWLRLTQSRPDH